MPEPTGRLEFLAYRLAEPVLSATEKEMYITNLAVPPGRGEDKGKVANVQKGGS